MSKTDNTKLFLVLQTFWVILLSFWFTFYTVVVMITNTKPHPEEFATYFLILDCVSISLSVLWVIFNTIYLCIRIMKVLPYILFWGYIIGLIAIAIPEMISGLNQDFLFISIYGFGWICFIGFLFSMTWLDRMLLVKISAISFFILGLLGIVVLIFYPYGWIVDVSNVILGALFLLMMVGAIKSLISHKKHQR